MPDKKLPGLEIEHIESGNELKYEDFIPFYLHDLGITHEVIPRVENRRLKTNADEGDSKKPEGDDHDDNQETENE